MKLEDFYRCTMYSIMEIMHPCIQTEKSRTHPFLSQWLLLWSLKWILTLSIWLCILCNSICEQQGKWDTHIQRYFHFSVPFLYILYKIHLSLGQEFFDPNENIFSWGLFFFNHSWTFWGIMKKWTTLLWVYHLIEIDFHGHLLVIYIDSPTFYENLFHSVVLSSWTQMTSYFIFVRLLVLLWGER